MKKIIFSLILLSSTAAFANPSSSSTSVDEATELRAVTKPVTQFSEDGLSLVPFPEEAADSEAPEAVVQEELDESLPPIMIQGRVKTYEKVVIGRRRKSLSSRGAEPVKTDDDEFIYKTVPKVTWGQLDISPMIEKYAKKHNLDPWLVRGVIEVESNFRPNARSYVVQGG